MHGRISLALLLLCTSCGYRWIDDRRLALSLPCVRVGEITDEADVAADLEVSLARELELALSERGLSCHGETGGGLLTASIASLEVNAAALGGGRSDELEPAALRIKETLCVRLLGPGTVLREPEIFSMEIEVATWRSRTGEQGLNRDGATNRALAELSRRLARAVVLGLVTRP